MPLSKQVGGREFYTDAKYVGDSTKGAVTVPTTTAKALLCVNTGTSTLSVRLKDKDGNTISSNAVGSLSAGSAGIIPYSTAYVGEVVKAGFGGPLTVYELY
jgi:hypothetical protein